MRSYTLALLSRLNSSSGSPVVESEIVQWTNQRLQAGQSGLVITHFQAGCSALIGRGPSRLCSDWLDHDVFTSMNYSRPYAIKTQ